MRKRYSKLNSKKKSFAGDISTFTGVQFPSPAPRIIQAYLAKINSIFRIVAAEKICFFGQPN
jgi:hypothetical protein